MAEQGFNMRFVAEIEKYPELYNFNLKENTAKKSLQRKQSWEAVAQAVDLTVNECKLKWKRLRNVMGRHMKPQPPGSYKRPYYLAEAMAFAAPFIKSYDRAISYAEKATPIHKIEVLTLPHDNETLQQPEDHPQVIVKVQQLENTAEENEGMVHTPEHIFKPSRDHLINPKASTMNINNKTTTTECPRIDLKGKRTFLLSLLPEIVPMTDDQMKSFRRRVLYLIDEITTPS